MCTMAINNQFNGIELTFESKPDDAIREAMKNAGFRWHRQKSLWYAKNTAERLALAKKLSDSETAPAAAPASGSRTASEKVNKFGVKVGDILCDTWGYSMTLVEFYKVTKIISATKIEIVELGHIVVEADRGGGERVMPGQPAGEPITKNVVQNSYEKANGGWHVKINDSVSLTPWSGGALYQNTWD